MSLVKFAMKKKVPILGICRGMQLINVYFKGTLYQDLKYNKEIKLKHLQGMARPSIPVHKVIFTENSDLKELFSETLYVNSFHHQGVKKVGENLKIVAKSTDNLVEGIEYVEDDQFILGVQWHPEMMYSNGDNKDMEKLFHYFIKKITK
jgi:putative glutamine amidotransferase